MKGRNDVRMFLAAYMAVCLIMAITAAASGNWLMALIFFVFAFALKEKPRGGK